MKKLILMVAVFAVLAVPAAMAQKINEEAFLAKIAKCDADATNAKKALKAATWLTRGKAYADAIMEPTKNLYPGFDAAMLGFAMGEPEERTEEGVWVYPYVNVHIKGGKVACWQQTKEIKEGAFEAAKESYLKALELDPKVMAKVKTGLDELVNYYSQLGSVSVDVPDYKVAVDAYVKAAELQETPVYSSVDPQYYFYAGQLSAFLGADAPEYFVMGEKYLNKAKELGYMDKNGNFYYFLFHCYYGQKDADRENIIRAKDALLEGIEKFPRNDKVLDGLMQLYTSEDNVGDPAELVGMIDKAIAESPDNADLWFGRGRVFFKLNNYDECITSFKKINELRPNDYDTNFYLGYFHIVKGDGLNKEFNNKIDSIDSQEVYEAEKKKVMDVYMLAVPYLEKAHELQPEKLDCAQFLKELCFRLRNEPGMMDKYNKYNAVYKKLQGIE